jgi:hypothetical protein
MDRRKGALLVGAGLFSEAIYLLATMLLPWWRYGGALRSWSQILGPERLPFVICLGGVAALMAAYLLGWRALGAGALGRRMVWGFALLFAVTLLWLMPITSDLFSYLSQAHMFTDMGISPLLVAPLDAPSDSLLLAYPAYYGLHPSVYGPAWILLSAPATLGRYDVAGGVFYLKALGAVSYLACAWLVERILKQVRPRAALQGLYLFAWNPLVLWMSVGEGHNDVVVMVGVLFSLWLLLRERWALAFGVQVLTIWIKYVSIVFVPLFAIYAWRRLAVPTPPGAEARERQLGSVLSRVGLGAMAVSALVLAPLYATEGWSGVKAWVGGAVVRLIRPVNWGMGRADLSPWFLGAGLLLFAVLLVVLVWRFAREQVTFGRLADTCFVAALLIFVLGAARSQPWHLLWPAALAGLSNRRWAWPCIVALSVALLWGQVWVEWGAPGFGFLS